MRKLLALLALLISVLSPAFAQEYRNGYYLWSEASYGVAPYVSGGYEVSNGHLTPQGERTFRDSLLNQSGATAMQAQGIPQEYQALIRRAAQECQIIYIPRPQEGVYFEQTSFGPQFDSQWRHSGNWCYCIVAGIMPRYSYFSSMVWAPLTIQPHVLTKFDLFYTQVVIVNKSARKGIGYGAPQRCINWSLRSFPVYTSEREVVQFKQVTVEVPVEQPAPCYETPQLPRSKPLQKFYRQESPGLLALATKILPYVIFPEGDRYTFNVQGGKGGSSKVNVENGNTIGIDNKNDNRSAASSSSSSSSASASGPGKGK